jgi:glycosyltransferase involved in cell wall biosynthesis
MKPENKLTILIDTVLVSSPGILTHQRELTLSALRQLPDGCKIVLLQNSAIHSVTQQHNLQVENIQPVKYGYLGRWFWYKYGLPGKIKKYNADVFYSLSGILSKKICECCATISSVNNMVPFTREQFSRLPFFSKEYLRITMLRHLLVKSVKMASVLILNSQHALAQIKNYVSGLENKTTVVLTGISENFKLNNADVPAHPNNNIPFFFYFSAIYWYKNHINLIEGYRRALENDPSIPVLFLAGYPVDKKYLAEIEQKIIDDNLSDKVKYIGILPFESIPGYLHHATINLFPSTCETNSLVQSEILGMHGVMACSDIPPMSEIPREEAAVLFDPYNPDSIAECIIRINKDNALQESLRKHAAQRSEELTWDACGKVIWDSAYTAFKKFKGHD